MNDTVLSDNVTDVRTQLTRQVAHWLAATSVLSDFTRLASADGWASLEGYLGLTIRSTLENVAIRLRRRVVVLQAQLAAAETLPDLHRLRAEIVGFRGRYLAAETILDFFGDAINTRTSQRLGSYLRACDVLARKAMAVVHVLSGRRTPPVLTYVDKGIGASILKAGLRLWDGMSVNPVAAIKVVWHNLPRPTALIHETGHQLAQDLGWNDELARVLREGLVRRSNELADLWVSWTSEIAADAFAFAQTGYAAVAALHDVISGTPASILRLNAGDPHPASYLRVLLGRAMCVRFYGAGPWDDLARAWRRLNPLDALQPDLRALMQESERLLPEVVDLIFHTPMRCFGHRTLAAVVPPARVKPESLADLQRAAGAALWVSDFWIQKECLRLLALSGLEAATTPERLPEILVRQEEWMTRLGGAAA